jgi:hypothetical protein
MQQIKPMPMFKGFVLACGLAGGFGAWAQDASLSAHELQASWVGKTMVGVIGSGPAAGKPLEFTMNADGTAVLSGAASDTGSWRLSELGYCASWKKIRNGQERCFTVHRLGADFQVINPDGSLSATISQIR